jgi:hypothetical protein
LHTITGKNFHRTVVATNRQRDRHGTFWKFQARAIFLQNLQTVGDQIKLLARHVESRMVVNFHKSRVALMLVRSITAMPNKSFTRISRIAADEKRKREFALICEIRVKLFSLKQRRLR